MSSQAVGLPGNASDRRGTSPIIRWAARNARIVAPLMTLIVEIIFFTIATDNFLSATNLRNVISPAGPVAVAATGIKAVLSGIGGDELFGGYPSFRRLPHAVMARQASASRFRSSWIFTSLASKVPLPPMNSWEFGMAKMPS